MEKKTIVLLIAAGFALSALAYDVYEQDGDHVAGAGNKDSGGINNAIYSCC